MLFFPPTLPQLFALLFLASIAALIGELIVGAAPDFGFLGALVLGVLGVIIFVRLPIPQLGIEPQLEDLPVVRGVLGGVIVVAGFAYYRKRRSR
jgi:uncharacterized membrane protein YeaQ/YmgE (transglycosylase-associated protein family)